MNRRPGGKQDDGRNVDESPLDIGELLGHLPPPDAEYVHSTDVSRLPAFLHPTVEPPDNAPVPGGEHLLRLEDRAGGGTKETFPEPPNALLSLVPLTVRWRAGVLED